MTKTQTPTPVKKTVPTTDKNKTEILFADTNISMKSGHLTRDAETVGDGKYVKMRLACNKKYTKDGEVKNNTNYFNAMISFHLTEAFDLAKSLKKGDWVYLKGEDSTRSFDTPEGYKKTANTIFAYHLTLKQSAPTIEPGT